MVRAKKHVSKFPWSNELEALKAKYQCKWVEGPAGKFWIGTVYQYDNTQFAVMAFREAENKGTAFGLKINDLEKDYSIIQDP